MYEAVGHEFTIGSPKQLEQVLFFDADPAVVKKLRTRFPALEDRRPSAYRR